MSHRPSLFELAHETRHRIARMGLDAIAQAHAAGVSAWVSDGSGRIVRIDPDGMEHVETRPANEILAAARARRAPGS